MKAIVSEKGQVTIPKPLRERLGIRPGQVLDFDVEAGRLVAVKSGDELDALDRLYGSLDIGMSTDEAMRELRGDYEPL
jgi:antitoxin PrlF